MKNSKHIDYFAQDYFCPSLIMKIIPNVGNLLTQDWVSLSNVSKFWRAFCVAPSLRQFEHLNQSDQFKLVFYLYTQQTLNPEIAMSDSKQKGLQAALTHPRLTLICRILILALLAPYAQNNQETWGIEAFKTFRRYLRENQLLMDIAKAIFVQESELSIKLFDTASFYHHINALSAEELKFCCFYLSQKCGFLPVLEQLNKRLSFKHKFPHEFESRDDKEARDASTHLLQVISKHHSIDTEKNILACEQLKQIFQNYLHSLQKTKEQEAIAEALLPYLPAFHPDDLFVFYNELESALNPWTKNMDQFHHKLFPTLYSALSQSNQKFILESLASSLRENDEKIKFCFEILAEDKHLNAWFKDNVCKPVTLTAYLYPAINADNKLQIFNDLFKLAIYGKFEDPILCERITSMLPHYAASCNEAYNKMCEFIISQQTLDLRFFLNGTFKELATLFAKLNQQNQLAFLAVIKKNASKLPLLATIFPALHKNDKTEIVNEVLKDFDCQGNIIFNRDPNAFDFLVKTIAYLDEPLGQAVFHKLFSFVEIQAAEKPFPNGNNMDRNGCINIFRDAFFCLGKKEAESNFNLILAFLQNQQSHQTKLTFSLILIGKISVILTSQQRKMAIAIILPFLKDTRTEIFKHTLFALTVMAEDLKQDHKMLIYKKIIPFIEMNEKIDTIFLQILPLIKSMHPNFSVTINNMLYLHNKLGIYYNRHLDMFGRDTPNKRKIGMTQALKRLVNLIKANAFNESSGSIAPLHPSSHQKTFYYNATHKAHFFQLISPQGPVIAQEKFEKLLGEIESFIKTNTFSEKGLSKIKDKLQEANWKAIPPADRLSAYQTIIMKRTEKNKYHLTLMPAPVGGRDKQVKKLYKLFLALKADLGATKLDQMSAAFHGKDGPEKNIKFAKQ